MEGQESVPVGLPDQLASWIAGLDVLLAKIKVTTQTPVPVHVQVEEDIRQALNYLFNAMELVVNWMTQGDGLHPGALLLFRELKTANDALAQCIGACPCDMVEMGISS